MLDVEGTWRELTGVVNRLAANLTSQVRSIAKVTKAVALGDLSKQIEVDCSGEILDLKNTVNRVAFTSYTKNDTCLSLPLSLRKKTFFSVIVDIQVRYQDCVCIPSLYIILQEKNISCIKITS